MRKIFLENLKLTGVSFGVAKEVIKDLIQVGHIDEYDLIREHESPYDPNTIKVQCLNNFLGWIPKERNSGLAALMDNGRQFKAELVRIVSHPSHPNKGVIVNIVEIV